MQCITSFEKHLTLSMFQIQRYTHSYTHGILKTTLWNVPTCIIHWDDVDYTTLRKKNRKLLPICDGVSPFLASLYICSFTSSDVNLSHCNQNACSQWKPIRKAPTAKLMWIYDTRYATTTNIVDMSCDKYHATLNRTYWLFTQVALLSQEAVRCFVSVSS